jgi:hypothetical protein
LYFERFSFRCCYGVCTDLVSADPVHLTGWLDVDVIGCESRRFVLKTAFTCDSNSNDMNFLWSVCPRSYIAHSESTGSKGLAIEPASN